MDFSLSYPVCELQNSNMHQQMSSSLLVYHFAAVSIIPSVLQLTSSKLPPTYFLWYQKRIHDLVVWLHGSQARNINFLQLQFCWNRYQNAASENDLFVLFYYGQGQHSYLFLYLIEWGHVLFSHLFPRIHIWNAKYFYFLQLILMWWAVQQFNNFQEMCTSPSLKPLIVQGRAAISSQPNI
jgi:hypothetical protein